MFVEISDVKQSIGCMADLMNRREQSQGGKGGHGGKGGKGGNNGADGADGADGEDGSMSVQGKWAKVKGPAFAVCFTAVCLVLIGAEVIVALKIWKG